MNYPMRDGSRDGGGEIDRTPSMDELFGDLQDGEDEPEGGEGAVGELQVEAATVDTPDAELFQESPEEIIGLLEEPDEPDDPVDGSLAPGEGELEGLLLTGRTEEDGFLWVDEGDGGDRTEPAADPSASIADDSEEDAEMPSFEIGEQPEATADTSEEVFEEPSLEAADRPETTAGTSEEAIEEPSLEAAEQPESTADDSEKDTEVASPEAADQPESTADDSEEDSEEPSFETADRSEVTAGTDADTGDAGAPDVDAAAEPMGSVDERGGPSLPELVDEVLESHATADRTEPDAGESGSPTETDEPGPEEGGDDAPESTAGDRTDTTDGDRDEAGWGSDRAGWAVRLWRRVRDRLSG